MQGVDHYENFPVASWLCPRKWRQPIAAIYHFARTADDLADEGDATANERLASLAQYRADLQQACQSSATQSARWPQVFVPLAKAVSTHQLPLQPMLDLLDAFEQDVRYTAAQARYANEAELLDYCSRSANPVGRLLLHLYGVNDTDSLAQSDDICTALQLINFWQDLGQDLQRNRHYLPIDLLEKYHLTTEALCGAALAPATAEAASAMLKELCEAAQARMLAGASLAVRLPGRVGWELRLVVQGGLQVLHRIRQLQFRTWQVRPKLHGYDVPIMLWRAAWMASARLQS